MATNLTIAQDDYFADIERVIRVRDQRNQKVEYTQIDNRTERRKEINRIRREKEMKKTISVIGFVCTIAALGLCAMTAIICTCIFKMEFYSYLIAGLTSVAIFGGCMSAVFFKMEKRIKGTYEALIKAYDRT